MVPKENKNTIHFKQRLLPNCLPHELEIVTVNGGESTNQYRKELAVVKFTGKRKKIKSSYFIATQRIWGTVQKGELIITEHLPLVLPVCPLPESACTYHIHCATGSTLSLVMSTQYVDRAAVGTEICRSVVSVICEGID
jgi:hypothetical protein